jgi:transposase-like protein
MRKTSSPAKMGFVKQDLKRLAVAMKCTGKASEYRRLQAVRLVAQGHPIADVSRLTQAPERSIYRWVEKYLETHSAAALEHREGAGRPEAAKPITIPKPAFCVNCDANLLSSAITPTFGLLPSWRIV